MIISTFIIFSCILLIQAKTNAANSNVCPPFHLRDEFGTIINPNTDSKPYSPKQTCGYEGCHDYDKITKGYHFTQGAGEKPTLIQDSRCQWAITPGNYGGTWCSPAPLYKYLSPKDNKSARTMDMTSFTFITTGCGKCHPGGGSAEYDRHGNRYDRFMQNKKNNLVPGGKNNFDGDYYKAHWDKTGVLEADCMICHLPEYDFSARNEQLERLNFRWAPTEAAGFGHITGSIANNQPVQVKYNLSLFDENKVSPHIVLEPRDSACLSCHAKPGWKKRGANFRSRTDVHIRAGLKCVDCHPAGSNADDERINGKEMHQLGKGDDPGGHVRNDLDNTCRDCKDCHNTGYLGAPVTRHAWLPPLHLETISCQTCHIPERTVKSARVQAGDVYNSGTKIPSKGKHLWTFYGPDMQYWNHYGDLSMMGYDDKPTHIFTPLQAKYKGKIFPVNRVHSSWPAIQTRGKKGLMQPKMGDVYQMWSLHFKNASIYPNLNKIKDDNGDGQIEINRVEEIDAIISSVKEMLLQTNYPMDGKQVVWVMNDRIYTSGSEYNTIDKKPWEASAYGNAHKYNHDVFPAKSALGRNGCTDCHHPDSRFFFTKIVKYPFDEQAKCVTFPQYQILGLNKFFTWLGIIRETYLKPILYMLLILFASILTGWVFKIAINNRANQLPSFLEWKFIPHSISITVFLGSLIILFQPELSHYALPNRFWLDSNHFIISILVLFIALLFAIGQSQKTNILFVLIAIAIASGSLMLLNLPLLDFFTRIGYTVFDLTLVLLLIMLSMISVNHLILLKQETKTVKNQS
jgi:hypothetical protein